MNSESDFYNDGKLYDAFHDRASRDISFYRKILDKSEKTLEIGAGTGRITHPLSRDGFLIEGLDVSLDMIQVFNEKAACNHFKTKVHLADACHFNLDVKFDNIIFPANGFLHLSTIEDYQGFFDSVNRHLRDDGRLILDIFNPNLSFLNREPSVEHFVGTITFQNQELNISERTVYDQKSQLNHITWYYRDINAF